MLFTIINSQTNKISNMKEQVIEGIKRKCGKVRMLNNGWCHFTYRHLHFVNIPDGSNDMIRISIPHVADSTDYTKEVLDKAINETNREVKFIKAMVLNNGSISLNYDHRISNDEKGDEIVSHMIITLFAAAEYLKRKLKMVTSHSHSS